MVIRFDDGDQLDLELFRDEPWGGQSPRVLTRGFRALSLRPEPPRHEVFFDPEQLVLWPIDGPHRARAPELGSGAPLLLEPCLLRR